MSTYAVAVIECRRLLRSPGVWLATIGLALVMGIGVVLPHLSMEDPTPSVGAAFLLGPGTDLLLPFIVIIFTYGAIAGHRDRGSIHVLLASPVDRSRVFLGLLLARSATIFVMTAVGVGVGIVAIVGLYGLPPARPVFSFVLLTILGSMAFASIGVGTSALLARPIHALSTLLVGFVVAHALWEPLVSGLAHVVGFDPDARGIEVVTLLSPLEAYSAAADGVLPPSPHLTLELDGSDAGALEGELVGGNIATADLAMSIGVLIGWAILVVLLGHWRFERAEIR